jgi:hypothetical protein
MTRVTMEQSPGGWQTYFRLKDVGRYLQDSFFRIRRLDANETLGPEGWKSEDISNEAPQYLEDRDLLLEIDSRLINYFETGRPIEIHVAELNLSERVLPPQLDPVPASRNVGPREGTRIPFQKSPLRQQEPASQRPGGSAARGGRSSVVQADTSSLDDDDVERTKLQGHLAGHEPEPRAERGASSSDRDDRGSDGLTRVMPDDSRRAEDADGHTAIVSAEDRDPDESRGDDPTLEDEDEADGSSEQIPDEQSESNNVPEPRKRRAWARTLAAVGVGLVIGFFSKYIYEEYFPDAIFGARPTGGQVDRDRARVLTDAFAPLANDLKQVAAKSPLGVSPDTVVTRMQVDRGTSFYNYGAKKANEGNKPEAVYWYKQSLKTCNFDAITFLGDAYLSGEGVQRDTRTGFQLMRLSAALGSEQARTYIIELLRGGSVPNAPRGLSQAYEQQSN